MYHIPSAVFDVGFVLIFVALGLGLGEFIGVMIFFEKSYGIGVLVVRGFRSIPNPFSSSAAPPDLLETDQGKFKLIAPNVCLCRRKIDIFEYRYRTPFSVKCIVRWNQERAQLEGRIPLGPTVLCGAWVTMWLLGSIMLLRRDLSAGLIFLLPGLLVGLVIPAICIRVEIARVPELVDELNSRLRRLAA